MYIFGQLARLFVIFVLLVGVQKETHEMGGGRLLLCRNKTITIYIYIYASILLMPL
jgi:hypothetical protein